MRMGALYISVIVLSSALFFLRLCGGVATGQCSWYCSSPNHPGGIADTVGPQLEDLQHCCLGECCLKIQLRGVSEETVVHLFDFIRVVSSCDSYYINLLGWPKYMAPPEFAFNCRAYRFNLHPGVPLFKKCQHPSLYRITVLTQSSATDSRWSKNAWCKVAVLQFTIHLMPELTHNITVRQVVDCKVMTVKLGFVVICICKYTRSQQDHLKVHSENPDDIVSFGLLFIILLFLFWLFFSLFMFPEVLFGDSAIFMSKTHIVLIFFGGCVWQCFASSFPWVKLV